jgi:hypothetical protein
LTVLVVIAIEVGRAIGKAARWAAPRARRLARRAVRALRGGRPTPRVEADLCSACAPGGHPGLDAVIVAMADLDEGEGPGPAELIDLFESIDPEGEGGAS